VKAILQLLILLAATAAAAGCAAPEATAPTSGAPTTDLRDEPADVLARLSFPVKPDGKRALAELEKFVAVAPRRYDNQFDHAKARDWLEAQFKGFGLDVQRHRFTGAAQTPGGASVEGQNILAVHAGRTSKILLFGAHYDGAASGYGAAYDDGGGTLIVVELARVLSQYEWEHTLVFAAWDQEEAGLVGSDAYAKLLRKDDAEVVHAMNFDMTGINWPAKFGGATDVPLRVNFGGDGADHMVALWKASVGHAKYPGQSTVAGTGLAASSSDHASFLRQDYSASWVRGAVIGSYPMYHNADTVESMIVDVGGKRADLEAGFDTVVQLVFTWAFLVDALPPPAQ
jgi:hypothetical protein